MGSDAVPLLTPGDGAAAVTVAYALRWVAADAPRCLWPTKSPGGNEVGSKFRKFVASKIRFRFLARSGPRSRDRPIQEADSRGRFERPLQEAASRRRLGVADSVAASVADGIASAAGVGRKKNSLMGVTPPGNSIIILSILIR